MSDYADFIHIKNQDKIRKNLVKQLFWNYIALIFDKKIIFNILS